MPADDAAARAAADGRAGAIDRVRSWVIEAGLAGEALEDLLAGFARLCVSELGLPLSRAYMAMPAIDTAMRSLDLTWRPGAAGAVRGGVEHDSLNDPYARSPVAFLIENDHRRYRWRIGAGEGLYEYPLLRELRAAGDTEYAAHLVPFGAGATTALRGVLLSVCTADPVGFDADHLATLNALVPALALAAYRMAVFEITVGLLDAYVGQDAGRRILNGEVRRGEGHRREAAILFADLRGFTAATETGGQSLVARLGRHLSAVAEPVVAAGGEVLKFMGDGVLAGFAPTDGTANTACAAALAAARDALIRNAQVNATEDGPPLALDVALHRGEVFWGNVGGGGRLDFTVIGPAVNEASRIERLCDVLDRPLLMSAEFAACCGHPTLSLGSHTLRGVAAPREIFCLSGGPDA